MFLRDSVSIRNSLFLFFGIIVVSLFFIKSSNLNFDKNYPDLKISSKSSITISNTVYSFTESFEILIEAQGYLSNEFKFSHSEPVKLIQLSEKPSLITFNINADDAFIIINGIKSEGNSINLLKGNHELIIGAVGYLNQPYQINLDKYYPNLNVDISLDEINKEIKFQGSPDNSEIFFNGAFIGTIPMSYVFKREGKLEFRNNDYESKVINLKIENNDPDTLVVNLNLNEALFSISSKPDSASVFVDGQYLGITPIDINLQSEADLKLSLEGFKDYYEKISPANKRADIDLIKDMIPVTFTSNVDAELFLNNKYIGNTPISIGVQNLSNIISFSKDGYVDQKFTFKPTKDRQNININLKTVKEHAIYTSSKEYKNTIQKTMVLFEPGNVVIGSPPSQSRRSPNEVLKSISINRHFYVSQYLITESDYGKFIKSNSNSKLPMTDITWKDAARFCNWLSSMEGFKPFYIFEQDQLINFDLTSTGYRLLTEAEWTYIIKSEFTSNAIYPWGNERTIPTTIANLADASVKERFVNSIANYDDGFELKSPVGSFKFNNNNVYDMLGNVSEWVNDFYSAQYENPNKLINDYIGPMYGSSHVIKGSNYQSFSSNQLGIDYRTDGNDKSDIIGFRLARWIY